LISTFETRPRPYLVSFISRGELLREAYICDGREAFSELFTGLEELFLVLLVLASLLALRSLKLEDMKGVVGLNAVNRPPAVGFDPYFLPQPSSMNLDKHLA
jgi:hypothetical protein